MRESPSDSAPQVELNEGASSPDMFEPRAKHPQREHVKREMREPRVHEHVRDDSPPRIWKSCRIESEDGVDRFLREQRELQEIHAYIQGQQPLNSARHARRIRCVVKLAH